MKAEMYGVKLEGTPEEIAKVIKLAGIAKNVKEVVKYVPYYPYRPPQYPPQDIWYWYTQPTVTAGGASTNDQTFSQQCLNSFQQQLANDKKTTTAADSFIFQTKAV